MINEDRKLMEVLEAKLTPLYKQQVREVLTVALDESVYTVEQTQMGSFSLSQLVETNKKIRDVTVAHFIGELSGSNKGVIHMLTGGKSSDGTYETYANVIEYKLVEAWETVMAEYQASNDEYDDVGFVSIYAKAVEYGIAPQVAPYNMPAIYDFELN